MISLNRNLRPSAGIWKNPNGPTTFGPFLFWTAAHIFLSAKRTITTPRSNGTKTSKQSPTIKTKLRKFSDIKVKNQNYKIKIYENLLDGSEHFALIKGKIKKGIIPRVRVISSNVVHNYLLNQQFPNSFNKTLNYFKKFNNCVLVFIKDSNLKSVTQTLKDYKNKDFYKKGNDKLIRNYGIGAQIIKDLKIKKMILITKSPKKVIGLDGYDIKITKQELI